MTSCLSPPFTRRITESYYEKKRKEYQAKQRKLERKIEKLRFADEDYYLTSNYLLKLASKASELFESSEPMEKRLLLKMTLQNLELKGKKARYNWIKPFDKIAFYASRQAWLGGWDDFRTFGWVSLVEKPEETIFKTQELLTVA